MTACARGLPLGEFRVSVCTYFSLSIFRLPFSFSLLPFSLFFLLYDSQVPHGRRNETFPCNRWEPERWYLGRWETESALVHCGAAAPAGRQRL